MPLDYEPIEPPPFRDWPSGLEPILFRVVVAVFTVLAIFFLVSILLPAHTGGGGGPHAHVNKASGSNPPMPPPTTSKH